MPVTYQALFDRQRLANLSSDERVLLLLLGYSANQIMMLQKLVWFCTNRPPVEDAIERVGSVAQTQMILRLLVGVLSESWRLVSSRFLGSKLGREYGDILSKSGKDALDNLKQQFGRSSLITKIRNNYAFHFPDSTDIEAAFEATASEPEQSSNWNAYFSDYNANTLFQFAEFVVGHGIMQQIGITEELESHRVLMTELTRAAGDLVTFANSYCSAVWEKYFYAEGVRPSARLVQAAPADTVLLPFLVEAARNET